MNRPVTIATHGDHTEQDCWHLWTERHFPSYEAFWVERVEPLRVPGGIELQSDAYLSAAGFTSEDVTVAQLHYTLLMHLGRTYVLIDEARGFTERSARPNRAFGRDEFFETFTRLSGASDVADELLARRANPGDYDAWKEAQGKRARYDWRKEHPDPLREIHAYRNRLVHGRVVPELYVKTVNAQGYETGVLLLYPRLGKADSYLDWRIAFDLAKGDTWPPDFAEAAVIAAGAWERVVAYVETAWQEHLLP
jgi:hypothetical protein